MITNSQIGVETTRIFLSSEENAITAIFFCNISASIDTAIDLYVVPAGATHGSGTQIMYQLKLPAGETFVFDTEKLILEDAATVWAKATADLIVTATISSVKIS